MNNEKIKDQISNTIKNPKKKGPYKKFLFLQVEMK